MNKHKRNIKITALLASFMGIIGFYLDGNVKEESIFANVFEILMMTSILFLVFSSVYFIINFVFSLDNKANDPINEDISQ